VLTCPSKAAIGVINYALQRTATRCSTLQHTARTPLEYVCMHRYICNLSATHTATRCNTLQHTATYFVATIGVSLRVLRYICNLSATHTATRCNTLQHTATHFGATIGVSLRVLRYICSLSATHAATRCNTLQHAATYCNTLRSHHWGKSKCALICLQLLIVSCAYLQRMA